MPEELKSLIRDLDRDVQDLATSYKRSRRQTLMLWALLLLLIVFCALWVRDSLERGKVFNGEIRDLACLAVKRVPPGASDTVDEMRSKYDCPPYVPPPTPSTSATVRPKSIPGRTVTAHATTTAHATATVSRPGPTATRTVGVTRPGPTRTVVRNRVITRTVTTTARPACRLLPRLC